MPYATNDGTKIYYETHGEAYADDEVDAVALCGELGYGPWQWGWQHAALAGPYELVTPATRGTDGSDAPAGPWSVADLATDLDAVLSDAGVRSAHVAGVGLGGLVALTAARDSTRVADLALVGTAPTGATLDPDPLWADPDDPDALQESLDAALSTDFRADQPDVVDRIVAWRAAEDADRAAWEAARAALAGADLSDRLHEVTNEAVVLHGSADAVCPPEAGRRLADGLPRGAFEPVADAGHLATVDGAAAVNDRLLGFFGG